MPRNEYAALATSELGALLNSGECDERKFQAFLEDHPILVPGVYPSLHSGHNGISPNAVISQPPLTALNSKVPDFCVIAWDSGTLHLTFVEIESPCKKWATTRGVQRAELTQAISQIRDWKNWFENSTNTTRFLEEYQVPDGIRRHRALARHYVLVYGRRSDFQASRFEMRRAQAQQPDETLMTWDRLVPSSHFSQLLTARLTPEGFLAHRVPPTITLGPWHSADHSLLGEKDAAVDASRHLSPTRAAFLKERWPYWDAWARTSREFDRDIISSTDQE